MYHVYDQTKLGHKHLHDPRFKVEKHGILTSLFMILIGVTGLYFGGKWVVDGAVFFANQLGVSEFVISATIIAFGTSLPELVTSIMASLRSDIDLAVGNIIGSNIFNIFFILGVTSLVNPVQIPFSLMADVLLLFFVTLFLFLVLWVRGVNELDRKEGILFVRFMSYT
jgi:cation:H+ antiporter